MAQSFFVTGTDTDVGKSIVTLALALHFERKNAAVYKPLQSGAYREGGKLLGPDLELVKRFAPSVSCYCSYLLEGECSPALAAKLAGTVISLEKIRQDFEEIQKRHDVVLVEGAGGLLCPVCLEQKLTVADVIKALDIPCFLVGRAKLGSVNHCLMTDRTAKESGLDVRALIINRYPVQTVDVAVLNMQEEISCYTDTPAVLFPELPELTRENILTFLDDKIRGLVG